MNFSKRLFLFFAIVSASAFGKGLDKKLFEAVLERNLAATKTLIEQGADVNGTTSGKESVLMCAAERGNPGIVQLLIDRGADINHRSKSGDTALMSAVANGRFQVAKDLLAKGAEVNASNGKAVTPLLLAVQRRDFSMMRLLLEKGADVNQQDREGRSPLHVAAGFSVPTMAEYLLMAGANVNAKDTHGNTPLIHAVTANSNAVCARLLEYGADLTLKNRKGNTARELVVSWNQTLANTLDHPNQLEMEPIQHRPNLDSRTVKLFLESGNNVNQAGPDGTTVIFHVVEGGDLESLKMLAASGADVNHVNQEGSTPLMAAAIHGRAAMVDLLLEKGANPNVLASQGYGALYLAGLRRDEAIARSIMSAGGYRVAKLPDDLIELPKDTQDYRLLLQQTTWLPPLARETTVKNFIDETAPERPGVVAYSNPDLVPPKFTHKEAPIYPRAAEDTQIHGYVILDAVLCKDGKIRDVRVLRPLGNGRYGIEEAAIKAVGNWRFKPGTIDGEAQDVRMTLKLDFNRWSNRARGKYRTKPIKTSSRNR